MENQNRTFLHYFLEMKKIYSIFARRKENVMMDKRFTPRTNEEMLDAVRALQARQKAFYERMNAKLEKEIYREEMA